jgi:hypothetical protein
MSRFFAMLAIALACAACAADQGDPADKPASAATPGCIAAGGGYLKAQLRGAVVADLNWNNDDMLCEGGPRPDGQGLRIALAGPLPDGVAAAARSVRFIFGVDLRDIAAGSAQALPTNLTLILEGAGQAFATRGDGRCAIEELTRTPLLASGGKLDRVQARGYCTSPATDLAGEATLLVPTFEFTGMVKTGTDP